MSGFVGSVRDQGKIETDPGHNQKAVIYGRWEVLGKDSKQDNTLVEDRTGSIGIIEIISKTLWDRMAN